MFQERNIRFFVKYILCSYFCCFILNGYSQEITFIPNILSEKIDSIVQNGIDSQAFPGAQIYITVGGKVIHHAAYGYHTYDKKVSTEIDHLYDLASITKVTTGLPILMKLVSDGILHLDDDFGELYREFKKSNKKNLQLRDILAHQAGMQPYIIFWQATMNKNGFKKKTFQKKYSKEFSYKISDQLFLHRDYRNKMISEVKKSKVKKTPNYVYSGLFFLLLPEILENYINQDFESYLYEKLYVPLGLDHLLYHPRERFPLDKIVPTEVDDYLRHCLVHGYVHDEAAAMLNGISCNAGLFGNAENLGKLFEFYLEGGKSNGEEIIDDEIIKQFAAYQFPENDNRRGLGFDKPLLEYNAEDAYIAKSASPNSFGHSGFTGTFVWADPDYNMVFVFLSNRVYPSRENRKIYTMGIRPKLHQAVYDHLEGLHKK
jgi:CubicO group peptidase (beta-lactamase class C family)